MNNLPGSIFKRFETCREYRERLLKSIPSYAYGDRSRASVSSGESLDDIGNAYNLRRRLVEDTVK